MDPVAPFILAFIFSLRIDGRRRRQVSAVAVIPVRGRRGPRWLRSMRTTGSRRGLAQERLSAAIAALDQAQRTPAKRATTMRPRPSLRR